MLVIALSLCFTFDIVVQSLLHRARLSRNAKEKQELRVWAEEETKNLLRLSELHYGEISHKTATAHMVQADVFVDMER